MQGKLMPQSAKFCQRNIVIRVTFDMKNHKPTTIHTIRFFLKDDIWRDAKTVPVLPNISSYENAIASNFLSLIGNNMGYQKVLNI